MASLSDHTSMPSDHTPLATADPFTVHFEQDLSQDEVDELSKILSDPLE